MTLVEKLSEIQCEMKAPKNLYNKHGNFNYRNAEGILEAFKPFAKKHKVSLTVSDDMVMMGDRIYVKATALLIDCESAVTISTTAYAREAVARKGMDDSQITGAASSYARKYALNGLLLLDDTKDADADEPEKEPTQSESKPASIPALTQITKICAKHGLNPEEICRQNGVSWKGISAEMAGHMLVWLKQTYKDE